MENQAPRSVAVAGCGYLGTKRIQACAKIPDEISLRAVMDMDKSRAAQAGAAAGGGRGVVRSDDEAGGAAWSAVGAGWESFPRHRVIQS